MPNRRWIIYRGSEILGYFSESDLPSAPEGCVASELSDIDDGVSNWYFDEEHGLVMDGAEPWRESELLQKWYDSVATTDANSEQE